MSDETITVCPLRLWKVYEKERAMLCMLVPWGILQQALEPELNTPRILDSRGHQVKAWGACAGLARGLLRL